MTLDLGFAPLRFDDGLEAGIVDVPGHERFLHNMLAGAPGMELLLLVLSATEGVMPQTLEHLQILAFLNVKRTIVVVTKTDLLAPGEVAGRLAELRTALAGTIASGAPSAAVSNLTGDGIDDLRMAIHDALAGLAPRDSDAPAYLPVDRVFALPGRGTIVTGTLMQGRVAVGDSLALEPLGQRVRVRSLHVFGESRDEAFGGTRVALNVPGVDRAAVTRGQVVADARFSARAAFDVRFTPVANAVALLRKRTPVRAHIGSAEIIGTLLLAVVPDNDTPVEGRLVLREPVLAFPGVRFVLRRLSPKTVLGGGEIEALAAQSGASDAEDPARDAIGAILRETGLEPLDLSAIAFRANLREEVAQRALEGMIETSDAFAVARPAGHLDGDVARQFLARVSAELSTIHDAEPWAMGVTSIALARTLALAEGSLVRLLAAFVHDGRLVQRAGYYALPSHQPQLSADQRSFFDETVQFDSAQPFVPAPFEATVSRMKQTKIPGIEKAFDTLLARGSLVKVGDALYRGTQIAAIHARVQSFIDQRGKMTMADFRDLLGTSRKYAVPLLEWFDARGITVRSGDFRTLRKRKDT